jgi:hypothetical protein
MFKLARSSCPSAMAPVRASGGPARARGARNQNVAAAPPLVGAVLDSAGQALEPGLREFFTPRFGVDLSNVRIHTGSQADASARAVGATAYTVGHQIVFRDAAFAPQTTEGRRLLAHELTHVVQQRHSSGRALQRACLSAAACAGPIAGSSEEFGVQETNVEAAARARRAAMSAVRQRSSGHTGPARQLEIFLDAQAPGLRTNIHGIFVDQDLSPGTGALTMACDAMVPPITGATKPCIFIHGNLNQEAGAFNRTADITVGGIPREDWRVSTLQVLTHEIQHVLFDSAVGRPTPAAAAGCARADVEHELSELNAIMSEFPAVFRAIPSGAAAADPARVRLDNWFSSVITNPSESIRGILKSMRCRCDCAAVDAWVRDTFDFVTSSWTPAEKTAFNTELRKAVWGLTWPL